MIAFLRQELVNQCGQVPIGSFATAISAEGDKVYITWNGQRLPRMHNLSERYDAVGVSVVHIPESQRKP